MLLDIGPLKRHRDFRLLYAGQFVSAIGSFLTYVALPVQIYDLTKSSAIVGLLGTAQLIPVAITALWGGAVADRVDRRRLLLWCEALLILGSLALVLNSMLPKPSVTTLFLIAAFMSGMSGFHSPALESLTPQLVDRDELAAVSALSSLHRTVAAVGGPALAGICIATFGLPFAFGLDVATFVVSLCALAAIRSIPPAEHAPPVSFASIREGLSYAMSRQELIGSYVVDIIAVMCAMPMAVFPALAEHWGGPHAVGYLYSAMSVGALLITLFSGWTKHVSRRGAGIALAAIAWGMAIIALGYANSLVLAVTCLILAGAADMVSGLFRMTLWNETIPTHLRGRLAAIEQLSYMTGPLLGNARVGFMAERFGVARAITWGGIACVVGVTALLPLIPRFWLYRREEVTRAAHPIR
jgi:MFS family permease